MIVESIAEDRIDAEERAAEQSDARALADGCHDGEEKTRRDDEHPDRSRRNERFRNEGQVEAIAEVTVLRELARRSERVPEEKHVDADANEAEDVHVPALDPPAPDHLLLR